MEAVAASVEAAGEDPSRRISNFPPSVDKYVEAVVDAACLPSQRFCSRRKDMVWIFPYQPLKRIELVRDRGDDVVG